MTHQFSQRSVGVTSEAETTLIELQYLFYEGPNL